MHIKINFRCRPTAFSTADVHQPQYSACKLLLFTSGIHCIAFPQAKSHSIINNTLNSDGIVMMFSSSVMDRSGSAGRSTFDVVSHLICNIYTKPPAAHLSVLVQLIAGLHYSLQMLTVLSL